MMGLELNARIALPATLVLLELAERDPERAYHVTRALVGAMSDKRETAVLGAFGYFIQVSALDPESESDPGIEYLQGRLKDIGVSVFEDLKISNDDLDVLDETIRRNSESNEDHRKSALGWLRRFRDLCRGIRFADGAEGD